MIKVLSRHGYGCRQLELCTVQVVGMDPDLAILSGADIHG